MSTQSQESISQPREKMLKNSKPAEIWKIRKKAFLCIFQNIRALIFSKRNLQVFEDKILNIVRKTGRISSRAKTLNHSRRAENVQATPYWHKRLFTNEK